jgi:GNAT superfamily N-acetyltransferase
MYIMNSNKHKRAGFKMTEIHQVKTRRDLREFIRFPFRLYKGNKYWVPPLIRWERNILDPEKNPAFAYCNVRLWLALRNNSPVGRIAAIINRKYIEKWRHPYGGFGWFDFIDDKGVSGSLLGKAEEWLKSEGLEGIHGPLGLTNFDQQGMLIEGFDEMPTISSVYNYPYYPLHMQNSGYVKETDYVEYEMKTPDAVPEKIERIARIALRKTNLDFVKFRSKKEIIPHINEVFEVINQTYARLFSYVELSRKQAEKYGREFLPLLHPDYLGMTCTKEGKIIGFFVTHPSLSGALQKCRGRLLPFGIFHIRKALKHPARADLLLVGILPEYQNKGLNSVFMKDVIENMISKKISLVETNSELEDNKKMLDFWKYFEGRLHKRKRVYLKGFDK